MTASGAKQLVGQGLNTLNIQRSTFSKQIVSPLDIWAQIAFTVLLSVNRLGSFAYISSTSDKLPSLHTITLHVHRETEYIQLSKNMLCSKRFHCAIMLDSIFSLTLLRVSVFLALQVPNCLALTRFAVYKIWCTTTMVEKSAVIEKSNRERVRS